MNPQRSQSELRIGDQEREQAVSALGEHYLAGRLNKDEYDERTTAAWAAKTRSQLDPLFWDLPRMQPPVTATPPKARPRSRRGYAFPIVVAIVVLLAVLGAPWWVFLILGWMWLSGMLTSLGVHGCRGRQKHPT